MSTLAAAVERALLSATTALSEHRPWPNMVDESQRTDVREESWVTWRGGGEEAEEAEEAYKEWEVGRVAGIRTVKNILATGAHIFLSL